jgi:hypothetical protein
MNGTSGEAAHRMADAVAGPTAFSLLAMLTALSRSGRAAMVLAVAASISAELFCWTSSVSRGRNFPLWMCAFYNKQLDAR